MIDIFRGGSPLRSSSLSHQSPLHAGNDPHLKPPKPVLLARKGLSSRDRTGPANQFWQNKETCPGSNHTNMG